MRGTEGGGMGTNQQYSSVRTGGGGAKVGGGVWYLVLRVFFLSFLWLLKIGSLLRHHHIFYNCVFSLHLLLLLALELPPDGVADDLVPVDLRPGDWQLPPQGLEGGVRHGLVVLRDGALVVRLGALHQADKLLGQGLLRLE